MRAERAGKIQRRECGRYELDRRCAVQKRPGAKVDQQRHIRWQAQDQAAQEQQLPTRGARNGVIGGHVGCHDEHRHRGTAVLAIFGQYLAGGVVGERANNGAMRAEMKYFSG